jgi:hypothetical protein
MVSVNGANESKQIRAVSADLIPGTTQFDISVSVTSVTEQFLQERGRVGAEGIVAWIGRIVSPTRAEIQRAYVPQQTPVASDDGVGVYVSGAAITQLILDLEDDEVVLARAHSHPGFAFHSETDDLNRLISHAGAISIVVPYFARHGLRLELCSINEFLPGDGWSELDTADVVRRFRIT